MNRRGEGMNRRGVSGWRAAHKWRAAAGGGRAPRRRAALPALLLAPLLLGAGPGRDAAGVRPAAVAGSWYPDRPSLISAEVDRLVRGTSGAPALPGRPLALVVPHAGWRYSGFAAAAAFRALGPRDFDRVVVVAPSHSGSFSGYALPEVAAYRTPAGEVPICRDVVKKLSDGRLLRPMPGVDEREHSIEIELPFLQERLDRFCLVPILTGATDLAMQRMLAGRLAALKDGRTLFVFSSDFTHYGPRYSYTPYGASAMTARAAIRALDTRAIGFLSHPDAAGFRKFLDETSDTICGREGLKVLLELLPRIAPQAAAVPLAEYASIDMPGNESDNSVTYVALAYVDGRPPDRPPLGPPPDHPVCAAQPPPIGADLGDRLVRVARAAISTELEGTDALRRALRDLPASARDELHRLQGAFVTLNRTRPEEIARQGKLRGCIGQIEPVYPLAEAVVVAAVKAALEDRRFTPVRAAELSSLEIDVTVLSPPRPAASLQEIKLGRDGIILNKDGRRAVFLPQVPLEQGWTLEETLSHLSRKAGLPDDAWREGAKLEIFAGQEFKERHDR